MKDLRWVLVTGSTSGLGWKLVEEIVDQNIGVICLGRNPKKLKKLEEMFNKKNFKKFKFIQ